MSGKCIERITQGCMMSLKGLLPKFSLRTLLLANVVLAVSLHAWISWPRWAAESFVSHFNAERWNECYDMLDSTVSNSILEYNRSKGTPPKVELSTCERSVADICAGRRDFELGHANCRITIQHGRVTALNWIEPPYFQSAFPYFR